MLLSVVIPCYNERDTIQQVIEEVREQPYDLDIIVVDDCSTDGTTDVLEMIDYPDVRVVFHKQNGGKGRAVRTGFEHVQGDIALIQDADMECSPSDYPALLAPILEDKADVVFGSRFVKGEIRRVGSWRHYMGNRALTWLSNIMTDLNLTDMEVAYKVFRADILKQLNLRCDRFGIEPEIVAKVARLHPRIYEVAVTYVGRTAAEGKKISWKDGIAAFYFIIRFGLGFD